MKVTLSEPEAVKIHFALERISNTKFETKLSYAIARNMDKTKGAKKAYVEELQKLLTPDMKEDEYIKTDQKLAESLKDTSQEYELFELDFTGVEIEPAVLNALMPIVKEPQ